MKVEFNTSTNRAGSRVAEIFDVSELTGCSEEQIRQMSAIDFDEMLCDEWRDWLLNVTDGGWSILDKEDQ